MDLLDQRWTLSGQAAASRVGEETVLLHLGSGLYFGLDPLGTRIWQGLEGGEDPRSISEGIAGEYAEPRERVEQDVRDFLLHLEEHGLAGRA
jgi:hypothetical protein